MSNESMRKLEDILSPRLKRCDYSGVVLVHQENQPGFELAMGLANRADGRPMTLDTRLATASGTKGFTALAIVSMIEDGLLEFDTRLIDALGGNLPGVDADVTIEHLLSHTSGVGDYLDEDESGDVDDYVLDTPVHQLTGPEQLISILNRYPQVDRPGARWKYNNSGYVWLALAIERVSGRSFYEEIRRRVFEPAGMTRTSFIRSDELPEDTALGYLANGRTNVFHLPVIGNGDGGAYTTGPDMMRFWKALQAGNIVGLSFVERMTSVAAAGLTDRYGLGFWLNTDASTVQLEGMDAGVSFRSGANPNSDFCYCLIANNSTDVWPLASIIDQSLDA